VGGRDRGGPDCDSDNDNRDRDDTATRCSARNRTRNGTAPQPSPASRRACTRAAPSRLARAKLSLTFVVGAQRRLLAGPPVPICSFHSRRRFSRAEGSAETHAIRGFYAISVVFIPLADRRLVTRFGRFWTPTGRGLLATGTESCPSDSEDRLAVRWLAVGEARGRLRLPGSRPTDDPPGDDQRRHDGRQTPPRRTESARRA
jgi:hypothetical protein